MKNYKSILTFVLVIAVHFVLAAEINPDLDDRTKTFSVTKGGTLEVNIDPGEIEINTWDKNEIQILARGLDEEDVDNLQTKKSGNKVTVKYDSRWGWSQNVILIISAPKEFNYELNTSSGEITFNGNVKGLLDVVTMSGEVRVDDVDGDIFVKTSGGEIRTGNLTGKVSLNTQGGEILVGNIITGPTKIETMGGEIRLRDVEGDLDVQTYGGDIEIGNIGGNADVTTYGGDIKVDKVGGDAILETYGGDIRLKGATGTIDVSTAGGDIDLFNITGRVDAKTSAGDIYIELDPQGKGRSRIETAMGNILLVIPRDSKASIEAEIIVHSYGRNRDDRYKIVSDFEETTYDTDRRNREIYATYEINGGGEKIYLKTVNSDIEIRKARK